MTESPEPESGFRPWQPRFGLPLMLMVTFVFSVMGAAGYYLVVAIERGPVALVAFLLFTLTAPLFLVFVFSLVRSLVGWWSRR